MPTIKNKTIGGGLLVLTFGLMLFAGVTGTATAETQERTRPCWGLSLDGSFFWPSQEAVKTVYSGIRLPVTLRFSYETTFGGGFYAGIRVLSVTGQTQILDPVYQEEAYDTSLTVYGPQAGILYSFNAGKVRVRFGAGVSYNFYREEWRNASYSFSGQHFGFQVDAAAALPLSRSLSAFVKMAYLSIPTANGSLLEEEVNLGGLETGLGILFRF